MSHSDVNVSRSTNAFVHFAAIPTLVRSYEETWNNIDHVFHIRKIVMSILYFYCVRRATGGSGVGFLPVSLVILGIEG